MIIKSTGLTVQYASHPVLTDLTLHIANGDFVGIIGPNGSGKTTLLKALAGLLAPTGGVVQVDGRPLHSYKPRELAALIGVVPQQSHLDFAFTVTEVVAMGGYAADRDSPSRMRPGVLTERVPWALAEMDLLSLAGRDVTTLSGGEWQRVLIARALAQNPRALLLDEVTTHLDIRYKLEILDKVRTLNRQQGLTVVAVLHELDLAAESCSRLLLLNKGEIVAFGTPREVLSPQNLVEVFGIAKLGTPGLQRPGYQLAKRKTRASVSRVHVVGGGGSAVMLLQSLLLEGHSLSLGAVNREDADWEIGVRLDLPVAAEIPFAPLSAKVRTQNLALMRKADKIVVTDLPFGPGNVGNLEDVLEVIKKGKKVVLMDNPPIAERDFTDGRAAELWHELKAAGAVAVDSTVELLQRVNEGA